MKVGLATQVSSRIVAARMYTHLVLGAVAEAACRNTDFRNQIDDLLAFFY